MYKISKNSMSLAMLKAGIYSAKELAQRAKISPNTLSRINNGGSAKLPTIQALATALNCDPADLIEEVKE